jgi:hypothetical protein
MPPLVTADCRFFQALQNGPLRRYLLFVESLDERRWLLHILAL